MVLKSLPTPITITLARLNIFCFIASFNNCYRNALKILCRFQEGTVEEIWNALKTALDSGIQQFVPIKKLSSNCSLSWITQEIRRLMRKRDKLYQKQNMRGRVRLGVTSKGSNI